MTIKEIAAMCGVSRGTVDRVLNHRGRVKPETEQAVRAALEQAGYVCWQTTADGRELTGSGASRASALARQMDRSEGARNCLLLDDGAGETLAAMLYALERADFQVWTPVASAL